MTWLWTNITDPVLHSLGDAWQWLTSGSTLAVAAAVVAAAVVVIASASRRRR